MALNTIPSESAYDVVIIGGAIMGSSTAFFLSNNPDFDGRILVIERDARYENCSTAHTNSCIRQQFSNEINVRISQFAADFIKNLRDYIDDPRVPELDIQNYGYLYLADTPEFAGQLTSAQALQRAAGAGTTLLRGDEISAAYPFFKTDDILLGSINRVDEGYWDGGAVFDWLRRGATARGVEYVENRVVDIAQSGGKVTHVVLASGERIAAGQVVNCAGPRAAEVAGMVGFDLPVEPRKRFTWIFSAERPLDRDLPLTIDPSGVHMRQDGPDTYLAGATPDFDPAVDPDDFAMDPDIWEEKVWPILATRIPQFDALKIVSEWAGHYAYNTFDQNAIMGATRDLPNFVFQNGFSGHGLQQSPAMGRGTAEWLVYGAYRTLDLTPFSVERIAEGKPFVEAAVI